MVSGGQVRKKRYGDNLFEFSMLLHWFNETFDKWSVNVVGLI